MITKPVNRTTGTIKIDWTCPVTQGLDYFMLADGSITPRNLVTRQPSTPQGAFATGGGANATQTVNEAGYSYFTNNSAGTSDRFDMTLPIAYGQQHSVLVICKFDTIVPSLFPRMFYIDNGGGLNYLNMFARHTTNILFVQFGHNGGANNYTSNAAVIVPGTVQALGFTIDGTSAGGGYTPTMYADGNLVASSGPGVLGAITTGTSCRTAFMNDTAATANMMQGNIFAIMHWDRALTAQEMKWASANWYKMIQGNHIG